MPFPFCFLCTQSGKQEMRKWKIRNKGDGESELRPIAICGGKMRVEQVRPASS
jgi:hypothetical protein